MKIETVQRLLDHMLWADSLVGEGLERQPAASAEAWELYAHVLGAEQIWLARILGEEAGPVWPAPDLEGVRALGGEMRRGYRSLVSELSDSELALTIDYVNSAGDAYRSTVEDILHHVFLHGAYHRGQIALLLRGAGAEPAPSDFIAFARGAPTTTRADATAPGDEPT